MKVWAPFSAFTSLEQEMHSLLDRIGARPWLEGFGWKPDTDIYRDDESLVVQTELPGIDPAEDLAVDVEDNVLQITGDKTQSREVSENDRYVTERRFGSFRRNVMLPNGVDPDTVTADFDNGLLTVRVPLPDVPEGGKEPRLTRIDIDVRS
jgi:HSP20 family protein